MKSFFRILLYFTTVLALAAAAFALDNFQRADRVPFRTVLGDMNIGGLTHEEVQILLREKLTQFNDSPFEIVAHRGEADEAATVTFSDIGIALNEVLLLEQIPSAGKISNVELMFRSIAGQRIIPNVALPRPELLRVIEEKFPDIPRAKNAFFERQGKILKIREGETGLKPHIESALRQLRLNITFFEHDPLGITFEETKPAVFAADLERDREVIEKALPKNITLKHEQETFEIPFARNPEWVVIDRKPYTVAAGQIPYSLQWDPVLFSRFINEKIAAKLESSPENVRIWRDAEGKIQFDGHAVEGQALERERLLVLINNAIAEGKTEVEIPVVQVPPKVTVSEDLQHMGIRELLSVGHTRFAGSPVNRMHNIGVGISKFNGVLIAPEEVFSFGNALGEVDGSTGYKKELVIKPEGTIPEYGGGICQVSSTMYRAAIFGGLPIVSRKPHSYAVSYYAQVGGHGLDATVYPPTVDLKFKNDTPGYILVQSYVDGIDAYFKFYGTSDGRKVEMEGPFISNRVSAPKEPAMIPDPKLKAGERKQVEKAHAGFSTLWYRTITKNGVSAKESIESRYKAVPDKFLVGTETLQESQTAGPIEPVNPFE